MSTAFEHKSQKNKKICGEITRNLLDFGLQNAILCSMQGKSAINTILLFSVAVIWGIGFVVTDVVLDGGMSPILLNVFRFSIASLVMPCLFFKKIAKLTLKQVGYGALTAVFMTLGFGLQTVGMKYTSPANTALITGLNVVMVPFFAWIARKQRPAVKVFIAAALSAVSTALLSLNGLSGLNFGDFLVFLCGVSFAVHFIVLDYTSKKIDAGALAFLQMIFATFFFIIYGLIFDFGGFTLVGVTAKAYWLTLELALLSTCYAYIIQTAMQKKVSPSYASLILSTEALFGAVFSVIFGKDAFSVYLLFAVLGTTAAIILVEYNPKRNALPVPADSEN